MPLDLLDELLSVTQALSDAGVPYAVCGGLALGIHGHPRMTKDLDVLVHPDDVARSLALVKPLGFDVPAREMVFGLRQGKRRPVHRISKLDDEGNLLALDFLHAVEELAGVWAARESFRYQGREIWVVTRDGLVTMKRIAGRPQDLADIAQLEGTTDEDPT